VYTVILSYKNTFLVHVSNMGQTNSVTLVRERTIPTGRPPLVRKVRVNLWG
jgi:hypothetical protein